MTIRRIVIVLVSLLLLYLAGIFFVYILIDYIVFSPVRQSQTMAYHFSSPHEEFKLSQPNGENINILKFEPAHQARAHILFLHGAEKSADYWASGFVNFFLERQYSVLFPDYRGYGKSDGRPSEFNWYEDAQLSYSWLKNQVGQDSIIIVGYGLGATAAAYLAGLSPCRLVVLVNPIYGIRDWFRYTLPAIFLLPRGLKYDFNTYEYIQNIISPMVLMINKNTREMSPQSASQLRNMLQDPGSFIELDHPDDELPLEDARFTEFFDLLVKEL